MILLYGVCEPISFPFFRLHPSGSFVLGPTMGPNESTRKDGHLVLQREEDCSCPLSRIEFVITRAARMIYLDNQFPRCSPTFRFKFLACLNLTREGFFDREDMAFVWHDHTKL